jgi:methionyl-tRNA synthetase
MEAPQKKLYIATAIPYVNGPPHIGHAMDYLLADIWTRYQKQNGHEVRFQVGTDEHGNKISAKAAENNLAPQEFADRMVVLYKNFIAKVGAEYTDFVPT